MSDPAFDKVARKYITGVVGFMNDHADKNVTKYFFSRSYTSGCGGHPDKKNIS